MREYVICRCVGKVNGKVTYRILVTVPTGQMVRQRAIDVAKMWNAETHPNLRANEWDVALRVVMGDPRERIYG